MSKHTEGPWLACAGNELHSQSLVYSEKTGIDIAVCYRDENGANARLIAEAPAMLRILNAIKTWMDDGGRMPTMSAIIPDSEDETFEMAIRNVVYNVEGE